MTPADYKLVIVGSGAGSGFRAGLRLTGGQSGGSYDGIGYNFRNTNVSDSYFYDAADTASRLEFRQGGFWFKTAPIGPSGAAIPFTNSMVILQSGAVGIGTTNPLAPIHISGGSEMTAGWNRTAVLQATYPVLGFNSTAGNRWAGIGYDAGWALRFWVSGVSNDISGSGRLAMSIDDAGKVGIGEANPGAKLEVSANSNGWPVTSGTVQPNATVRFGNTETNGVLDVGVNSGVGAWFQYTSRTDLSQAYPILLNPNGGSVGIGTTTPQHKLSVNGTIKAKEVIVETTGWSDYVFADDYRLAPLSEVEAHIKAEKRLPGIPSEQQVAVHGVSVGEMQAALLSKIEELTLHVISQDKRIGQLELENKALRASREGGEE